MKEIKKVSVFGTGVMGCGIVQLLLQHGYFVIIRSRSDQSLQSGLNRINMNLRRDVDKGILSEKELDGILKKMEGTISIEMASEVDLAIETVVEDLEIKKRLFKELDEACPEHTILATNTSSLSITEIAKSSKRPEKVIGLHFFNPVTRMKLVEIARTSFTSEKTLEIIVKLVKRIEKTPILLFDSSGFLVNRMLIPMINEAISLLMEGVANKEEIDLSMKIGANHPMGPLELADFIGLDICLNIMESLYKEYKDPKYRPCPLLQRMVRMGFLGRKTKKGFYEYQ